MAVKIAIVLGYCNVCADQLHAALAKHIDARRFAIYQQPHLWDDPLAYDYGLAEAEDLATAAVEHYRPALCMGVVCVKYHPRPNVLQGSRIALGVCIHEGVLLPKPLELSPANCRRGALGLEPNEGEFTKEATQSVLNWALTYYTVRTKARA